MSFSPNVFLSNIRAKDGLARPSRFEVILPIPPYINSFIGNSIVEKLLNLPNSIISDISGAVNSLLGAETVTGFSATSNPSMTRYLALQCENAELPGKTLQTADVKIYGPTFKVPYQTQYTDTTLTFVCTNEFYERKLFERWMEAIHPSDTNNLRYPKGANSRYMTNIKIIQYDEFIKQIYAVELIDAFPIGMAAQPLSWSDDGFHRLSIQFAYQRYRPIYDGTYDLGAAAGALFGVAGAKFFDSGTQAVSGSIGKVLGKIF
jgi:hypothetical protein